MTKVCPNCGAQYIASVMTCTDCHIDLVEETDEAAAAGAGAPAGPVAGADDGDGDELVVEDIAYQLDAWAAGSIASLDALLGGVMVPHSWEDTTLVVPARYEETVDGLVEQVELDEQPTLDPDAEQIEYELEDWSDAKREILDEHLFQHGIRHGWDKAGQLIIEATDEVAADAVIDSVDEEFADDGDALLDLDPEAEGDADEAEEASVSVPLDQISPQDVMADLFDGADRLRHKPGDKAAAAELFAATELAESIPLPYGFTEAHWDDLVLHSRNLADLLVGEGDIDAKAVQKAADDLRERLRDLV